MASRTLQKWFPGTTTPFICNAPMMGFANAKVAVAVHRAGGFGYVGGGFDFTSSSTQSASLASELALVREALGISAVKPLPIGVGFITTLPERLNIAGGVLPLIATHRPSAVWLFAPPTETVHAEFIPLLHAAGKDWGLKVFVQVGSVAAARQAVQDGADVLVIQGVDAGGHQWAQGASLMTLLPEVVDMLSEEFNGREVPVIAAGGVMDGRGVAAALVLGASGAVMGTRIVATEEAETSDHVKSTIISTTDGGQSTIKSTIFDDIQSTAIWPPLYDGRAIIGPSFTAHLSGLPMSENIALHNQAQKEGVFSRKIVWAGSGVGIAKSILPISKVIHGSQQQAREILARVQGYVNLDNERAAAVSFGTFDTTESLYYNGD